MLDFICGCYLAVLIVSGLLGVDYFSQQVSVDLIMAADGVAGVGGWAGITFGVELVVPWDAPEAVFGLQSEGVVDLGTIPDALLAWLVGGRVLQNVEFCREEICAMCMFWFRIRGGWNKIFKT